MPGADDLQNFLMEELLFLKPVSEQEIDSLFIEVKRIMEWYIKADTNGENMNVKWVRAALIKNLPKAITQHLAIPLRSAHTIDAICNLAMIYLYDHNTGLPRGQAAAKLYLTESNNNEQEEHNKAKAEDNKRARQDDSWKKDNENEHGDLDAAKGGKKGKGKGYGAC